MATSLADEKRYLSEVAARVDEILDRYLPSDDEEPRSLHAAMRYSVTSGGKRLRPILAWSAYKYCGGKDETAESSIHPAMAALEMVHTFSLIHDDLPCMDDDDLRRGRPTCHKKFGEAIAVLAGDALINLAFGLMGQTGSAEAVRLLSDALGTGGMLGGQIADVEAEGKAVDRDDVIGIHRKKTGALIRASIHIGAVLAGAEETKVNRLSQFGEKVGLAFQIVDDILDIEGNQELLGKQVGSDSKKDKATYPRAVGMDTARKDAAVLIDEAVALLENDENNPLVGIARYIGQRQN
jgi:geranylgeranyl diphosphate synthase type II